MFYKFILLTWKNWLLRWRHPIQSILNITFPLIFSGLLVVLRDSCDRANHESISFPPYPVAEGAEAFKDNYGLFKVVWSPCNNSALLHVMEAVAKNHGKEHACTKSSSELQSVMQSARYDAIAGIDFGDHLALIDNITKEAEIVLRFPAELRVPRDSGRASTKTWRTDFLYPEFPLAGPRNCTEDTGPDPSYYEEGFLTLQHDISKEIIKYHAERIGREVDNFPTVMMRRFPQPSWVVDDKLIAICETIGASFYLMFICIVVVAVNDIAREKELQLKELMKIMGVPNWLHWMAWFWKLFVTLVVIMGLIAIFFTLVGSKVLPYTDPFVFFIFLVLYAIGIIAFCFLVSVFFSKASTAMIAAIVFFYVTYAPYILLQHKVTDTWSKVFAMLGLNTAVCFGLRVIFMFEAVGEGLQFNNIFTNPNPADNLTMGHVLLMLIFDALLYLVLALYLEGLFPGTYGASRVWFYPCVSHGNDTIDRDHRIPETATYQRGPTHTKALIKMRNVTKIYHKQTVVVQNLSVDMFEGQIVVLLGQNGAGKSVTLLMLTGTIPPTSGATYINNRNLLNHKTEIRNTMSFCPQGIVLFPDLTVWEHLRFFSILKGANDRTELAEEIKYYMDVLDLTEEEDDNVLVMPTLQGIRILLRRFDVSDAVLQSSLEISSRLLQHSNNCVVLLSSAERKQRTVRSIMILAGQNSENENTRTKRLSGEMKRRLSVGIALCGKPKICILDEPTSGLDPVSRRALWDLIRSLKRGRTIVVSTQSTEEANYLGDRVAVMSNGALQCYGTNAFLNEKYGAGYHLIVNKTPNCDTRTLTEFLKNYIPSIKIVNNFPHLVTYVLDRDHSTEFSKMLDGLESNASELGVSDIEVAMSSIDEVLVKVNQYDEQSDAFRSEVDSEKAVPEKVVRLRGCRLKLNQFIALTMKKAIMSVRSWIILVILYLLPVCLLLLAILTNESRKLNRHTKLKISMNDYKYPTALVSSTNPRNRYYLEYLRILARENRKIKNWGNSEMTSKILKEAMKSEIKVRKEYTVGSSFDDESNVITAWYNNHPYHSSPLSLQYVMDTILNCQLLSREYKITFVHYPLPYAPETKIEMLQEMGFLEIPCTIGIGIAIVSALYVIFCIKDRICHSKKLQFISGVDIYLYWLSIYLWDFCTFFVVSLCIIVILAALSVEGLSSFSVIGPLFMLFMLFGFAVLPEMYLFSFCFHAPFSAFLVIALTNALLGPIMFVVFETLFYYDIGPKTLYDVLHWIFLFVPHYALTSGIFELSYKNSLSQLCSQIGRNAQEMTGAIVRSGESFVCKIEHNCCGIDEKYLGWTNHGIGRNICILPLVAILLAAILLIWEYRFFYKRETQQITLEDNAVDYDVETEKAKVRKGEINSKNNHVVLYNLTKFYGKKLVVNQLCLGVRASECFGFLGVHEAGKTTVFEILTGMTRIDSGAAWMYGLNVKTHSRQTRKFFGYCPQVDALLDDLTGKETLIMYSLLKGASLGDSKMIAKVIAKELGFDNHLDKLVKRYGRITKRKLSIAIALVGDPYILLLDEPTLGMDPSSKRRMWNALTRQRKNGKCILLTSRSIEECEAVCTRVAITVNGIFKCIGTPQHLRRKFSLGYTLTIKMEMARHDRDYDNIDVDPVMDFVKTNFPLAVLKEYYHNVLVFFIVSKRTKWSTVFALMDEAKRALNIKEYTIAQSSLEQMFLHLTKGQSSNY